MSRSMVLFQVVGKIDLDDVDFAICLDSLGQSDDANNHSLYMHFSKPPKEGQASFEFMKVLTMGRN